MAKALITNSTLTDIANAIRSKTGNNTVLKPSEMATAIAGIVVAALETKSISSNGTYTPSSGNNGFSSVTVNVPNSYTASDNGKVVSSGALVSQTSKSVYANGTYDTTENNSVTVSVSNSYSQSDEGKVVSSGVLVSQTSTTKTANGTYTTTTNNEVVVAIPLANGEDF